MAIDALTIQRILDDYGYDVGPIDGIVGPRTKAAIMKFQEDHDLVVDGIVGKNTTVALLEKDHGGDGQNISQDGIDLVKSFEGYFPRAYRDPVGIWTIGYGHTLGVKRGQTVTKAQAEELLREDLRIAEQAVRAYVTVPLTQGQFDALVSFAFNVGNGALSHSTLLRKLNAGDYAGARSEFPRWRYAGGKALPGLLRRRYAEAEMFA